MFNLNNKKVIKDRPLNVISYPFLGWVIPNTTLKAIKTEKVCFVAKLKNKSYALVNNTCLRHLHVRNIITWGTGFAVISFNISSELANVVNTFIAYF